MSTHADRLTEAILATAADPIIVIDETGVIAVANAATSRLFGFTHEALLGKNVSMLMPEPFRTEHDGYIQHYLETGETKIIGVGREVPAQRSDGSTFPMFLSVSEVNGWGNPVHKKTSTKMSQTWFASQTGPTAWSIKRRVGAPLSASPAVRSQMPEPKSAPAKIA